ncbi:MAG: hypothetical protein LC772_00795 [Chloroflexi bacterium]|nr:hypothetical protein [Chloroflexota bacterium]
MDNSAEIARYLLWTDVIQGCFLVFFVVACAGIIVAVMKLLQLLNKVEGLIDPLAGKGGEVLEHVDQTLVSLKDKAESMLDVSEQAVKTVAAKVDTTSSLVEGAVARPAISLSSVMAGINRGLETWRHFQPAPKADSTGGLTSKPSAEMASAEVTAAEL